MLRAAITRIAADNLLGKGIFPELMMANPVLLVVFRLILLTNLLKIDCFPAALSNLPVGVNYFPGAVSDVPAV